jgi:SnoaL-like domain
MDTTPAQRFIRAFGTNDRDLLDEIYDDDVVLYSPIGWGVQGKQAMLDFVGEFHKGYPGLRIVLHDEFYSADRSRGAFRFVHHWHNTGEFYGHEPTGMRGTQTETHMVRIRDGRIHEQVVGDTTFQMPYLELVVRKIEVPWETPDPAPEIISAGGTEGRR